MQEMVKTVMNEFSGRHREQQARIDDLSYRNQILKNKADKEEEWMRRVAIDILDSEEESVSVCLRAIWHLSENSANSTEIVRSEAAMRSILDIMVSEKSDDLVEGCLGIFCNLCRGKEARTILVTEYEGEYLTNVVLMTQQVIERSVYHFEKRLELAMILLFNLALCDVGAMYLLNNWIPKTLIDVLNKHKSNETLCDLAVAILNMLFDDREPDRMMFLGYDLAHQISSVLTSITPSCQLVSLQTKLRLIFPHL